jgi:hypothetical protein
VTDVFQKAFTPRQFRLLFENNGMLSRKDEAEKLDFSNASIETLDIGLLDSL